MKSAIKEFFDRTFRKWEDGGFGLPTAPWRADVDPSIWQGPPNDEGYAPWRPLEKTVRHDLAALAPDLGPLHPSLDAYFNSWWFCALEGAHGPYGISLEVVLPGIELDSFLRKARGYAGAHGGRLDHVAIGVEFDGFLVVVDNRTGEVALEDFEQSSFEVIAPSLENLIRHLTP